MLLCWVYGIIYNYAEFHYADCRYTECRSAQILDNPEIFCKRSSLFCLIVSEKEEKF